MTPSATSIQSTPRTRRALLAGALGGLGAFAATVVARTTPVRAANGDPVLAGQTTTATAATSISRSGGGDAFQGLGTDNDAVNGYSTSGRGVYGNSSTNAGVFGTSGTGPALEGWGGGGGGVALRAEGRLRLSTSGVARISAGSKSKTITPGVDINPSSFVLLTAKANIGARTLWFTTDGPNERFTIHMSSARNVSTKVAWLLVG